MGWVARPSRLRGLFLFYEFFGVLTNLAGGALGARFGLRSTLVLGLGLQSASLGILGWRYAALSLPLVMCLQAASGVAKDLTKMSAKSYTKFLVAEGDGRGLMRLVSWLTGSKNTLKGAGFFLGGYLLAQYGFREACLGMAAGLVCTWLVAMCLLPKGAGRAKKVGRPMQWLAEDRRVLWLSFSRLALFASRDVWFVLALPLYLSSQMEWNHTQVGGFLAVWVIAYGAIQALAPSWVGGVAGQGRVSGWWLMLWTLALGLPLGFLLRAEFLWTQELLLGLGAFAFVFATCSSLHSYLIIAFSARENVSQQVGAYYAANALGRFVGTLASGWLYQRAVSPLQGLQHALFGALVLAGLAGISCLPLALAERRMRKQIG